ncbi:MAG: alpha/beta hydrolase [Rickettsiaceae bacterium]|jgi:esterase/lipase|nr:alpha/beta hydrolase [Rickettsiaceae bacterium]
MGKNLKDGFRSNILRLIKTGLVAYLGLAAILFTFQTGYIYYPNKTDFQNCPSFKDAEKISFGSSRGYFTKRSSEKVIVFYHGNAGRACDRNYLDKFFAKENYSTYFVEYSGYAQKENHPSMKKLLKNVEDSIKFLETKNFKHIAVIAESIGTGPAAYHAANSSIHNLILITPYNNLASVAFSHYPIYPMSLLLLNNFTPDIWLSHYKGPVSIILAGNDEVIPTKFGRKLYEDINSDFKKIYVIEDAGHNSIYDKEEFYSLLRQELK